MKPVSRWLSSMPVRRRLAAVAVAACVAACLVVTSGSLAAGDGTVSRPVAPRAVPTAHLGAGRLQALAFGRQGEAGLAWTRSADLAGARSGDLGVAESSSLARSPAIDR